MISPVFILLSISTVLRIITVEIFKRVTIGVPVNMHKYGYRCSTTEKDGNEVMEKHDCISFAAHVSCSGFTATLRLLMIYQPHRFIKCFTKTLRKPNELSY